MIKILKKYVRIDGSNLNGVIDMYIYLVICGYGVAFVGYYTKYIGSKEKNIIQVVKNLIIVFGIVMMLICLVMSIITKSFFTGLITMFGFALLIGIALFIIFLFEKSCVKCKNNKIKENEQK